jgi:hypothetical protein
MYRVRTILQGLLAAAAIGAALSVAAPAGATTLLSASMDTSNTAFIKGGVYGSGGIDVYIGPVTFQVDANPADAITGFCIDIYHDMFLGSLNGGAGYGYHPEALQFDSSTSTPAGQDGIQLSQTQLNKIDALVDYAAVLEDQGASDLSHKLAGIQGAIWQVEYGPTYTVAASGAVQGYITTYAADAAVQPYMPVGPIHSLFADDYGHQAFAFAGGVPEPGTWALMIMGFGGVGAVLRRRRQATAFA